jgi:glycosyltransferase involved in cell wall biosynthesis
VQQTQLSIILPVKNIEQVIEGILRFAADQAESLEAEFIIVDMGSTDRTVLQAVQFIKSRKLRGFVIQNGDSTAAAALNTGLQKAVGDYVTFIFARRLYLNFIRGYLDTALRTEADFVYGCENEDEVRSAERHLISRAVRQPGGMSVLRGAVARTVKIDISAVLVSRKFLADNGISFTESCRYGYSEEFLYRCLLAAGQVAQAPTLIKRDGVFELKRGKQKPTGEAVFQRAEAMLRVLDAVRASGGDPELIRLFEKEKLPEVILDCVDVMLREGNSYGAVKLYLRDAGYDGYLVPGRPMDRGLFKRILVWRTVPWMYAPK